ncbi:hypothetical protein X907_1746 [Glycocaulis alkaliphilus]|uniref:Uncharacterized protein n=1 Tax=Glycocaulis alkaliphilus TaxID=1434191 RepID=A0A3T0EAM5_9PROT|nr:hypothetical protein X907_1746 [Glycocaulis alkaliphilus]
MAAAHATLGRGGFALRDRHGSLLNWSFSKIGLAPRGTREAVSGGLYLFANIKATGVVRQTRQM